MPVAIVAAAVIGGIMSQMSSSADRQAAQTAMQAAVNDINQVGAPPDLAKQIILQHFQSAGILTPELAQSIPQEFDKAQQIVENPSTRTQETGALAAMQNLAQTGLSAQDMAAMQQLRNQSAGDVQAKQNQIIQQFSQMGQGSGGASLAARLLANQQGGQNEANQAIQIGGQAAQNRANAIAQMGQMASNIRGQDYATLAANTANRQAWQNNLLQNAEARNMYNTQTQNQSNLFNLENNQQLQNMNVQQQNAEALRERQAQQQEWQDQLALAQSKANAQLGNAQFQGQQAQAQAQGWQQMGSGVSSGLASVYGAQNRQNNNNNGGSGGGGGGEDFSGWNVYGNTNTGNGN